MTYRLIRRFEKTNDQTWSGIYYNVQNSLNGAEDARDAQFMVKEDSLDVRVKAKEVSQMAKNISGYIGSERIHEDDNVLSIIYHFDSLENTLEFRQSFVRANTAGKIFVDFIKEKQEQNLIPVYNITSMIIDPDGNRVG